MTNKLTRLNIISKLNFENITTTQNFANIINDNNPYTKLTWNTFSSSATMECVVSDNIKYANLSSNYNRFRTQISYFNDRSFNFIIKFRLTELRSIQNIVTINNGTTHFVCNIKNTFDNGLSLYNSNGDISINCNYKFEADIDYVISISKDEDIYKVIINGTQYLCTENISFKNNLPSSDSSYLILGCDDINPSDNINSLRGRLYWANLSIGPTMIFNGSYTKYGSSLKSFLYFGNKAINDTATSYYAPLEAIEDSIITWNGLENIDSSNINQNELICTGTNSFYTNYNINNPFTLTFKYRLNVALDDVELISYYGYKLLVTNVVNDSGIPDDPEVSVNEYTTSALNFENGIIDEIPTTIWNKEGTADITSVNKIFGDNSFETKALGDSLYTSSNVITGGSTPFTIDAYYLFRPDFNTTSTDTDLSLFSLCNDSGYYQGYFLSKSSMNIGTYRAPQFSKPILDDSFINKRKIKVNEINKITISYDGSSLRSFINDELDGIYGTSVGLEKSSQPLRLMSYNFNTSKNTTSGLIDNINIHDGIATKVRDHDPYEEFLVVDLAFDGENNSTEIVDNARLKERNEIKYNDYVVSLNHFNGTDGSSASQDVKSDISWTLSSTKLSNIQTKFGATSLKGNKSRADITLPSAIGDGDFTIEFWVYPTAASTEYFFSTPYVAGAWFAVGFDGAQKKFITFLAAGGQRVSTETFDLNTWYHVAIVKTAGYSKFYVNGQNIAYSTEPNTENYTHTMLHIAGTSTSISSSGDWFSGFIDEFRYTHGVARYTENFTPPTESFNYVPKNNWTVNGNAKISTDQPFDGFSSLYLNNGRVNSSLIGSLGVSDFTINFDIIRMNDNSDDIFMWGRMLCIGDNSTNGGLYIARESQSSDIIVELYQNGYIRLFTTTDSPLVHNKKVNIRVIRENGVFNLYIDGILKFSNSGYTSYNISATNMLIGGNNINGEYINGYIKNFKIYKGVAVIPKDPTGKIQLDFDNNVVDKYGNSTWTDNGVIFDQVNSVKGYSAYFDSSNNNAQLYTNTELLNFENKNFQIELDYKTLNNNNEWSSLIVPQNHSYPSQHVEFSTWNSNMLVFQNLGSVDKTITGVKTVLNQWYNAKLIRNKNCVYITQNDVITDMTNYSNNDTVNFNISNDCSIGGVNSNKFGGYIDNFKSIKDYQEPVIIDKPAIHLPLETNAINTGFTQLTINSVGDPTYTTVEGKKCIKFESGKYLEINSNNIFNLGTSSDFYMEFDVYIDQTNINNFNVLLTNGSSYSTGLFALTLYKKDGSINSGRIYVDTATNGYINDLTTYNNNEWNNIRLIRNNNTFSLVLNGYNKTFESFNVNLTNTSLMLGYCSYASVDIMNGYMSNFKMFVGTSEIPETYNDKKVLDLDFKPTRKSYLFKDNNNKCVIHPVNITQRDYQDSQYCCTFNGVDQYLQFGKNDLLNFGNDDFIMYCVFKPTIFKNDAQIILADGSSTVNTFGRCFICIENSSTSVVEYRNKMFIGVNIGTNTYSVLASTNVPNLNAINTLTIVRSGNILKLKLNDDEWNINSNFTNSLNFNLSNNTIIGRGGYGSSYFNGYIYKIKIFRNTSDITVLNDPIITPPTPSETIYTLTDGTNTETISLTPELSDNEVTFYNKEFFIDVKVNDDNNVMSLPKNTSIIDNTLTINNGFKGYIKDIKFYDTVIPFNDSDSFIDYDPYNTEFNQVEIISDDFTELNTLNIGNNNITGFLEGCISPISYDIIHKSTGAILMSGDTPYYSYNNIDIRYIDEYVIIDSNNKEYELINKSLDKEGFLIFVLDAASCQGNFCIRLYKHLTGKLVGEYEIINNQCQIDHLFIDERYDAVLFDRDSNIESKTLSDRIPEIKIV